MASTPATAFLATHASTFVEHPYSMDLPDDVSYGEAVAAQLGVSPQRLFKTLITEVDGSPVCAIVPVAGGLSLCKLAAVAGGKRASLADQKDAQRWTGYPTGGISPFGQKKRMAVVVDETADLFDTVYTSGGQRGLQIEFQPSLLADLLGATFADIAA